MLHKWSKYGSNLFKWSNIYSPLNGLHFILVHKTPCQMVRIYRIQLYNLYGPYYMVQSTFRIWYWLNKCEFFDQFLKVLTTGGTIDKEYPQGVGGYAFEFGTVTAAQRIKKRTHSKFEIERICSVDSQGMNILSLFGATSVETS